jgi:acetyltransferase-like isoleucine patch superfamily enzyme
LAKGFVAVAARVLVFPVACIAGFGRWRTAYVCFAQALALAPGIVGSYLRVAYYGFTLEGVGPDCHISLGSYFAQPTASLGPKVGIGAYCVLGSVDIGEGSLLASMVQILSGTRQHSRDDSGRLTDQGRVFRRISIGPHCWIGAGAIISADVGAKTTIGPGSVVTSDLPSGSTVSGNPARNFSLVVRPGS